ncbi:MAG TPA: TIGR03000 domain-containing protein [Gemmataceae bacterium]|nr:TIGR03000 domain-containing protein [Gemmataceae bacterium]
MKKFVLIVAVVAMALLVDSQLASAGRRGGRGGCGGGGGGCGGCGSYGGGYSMGGCGMGGCGSYGMGMGGCGMGGCGMGGFGGYAGCQTCGGGYVMGAGSYGAAPCMTCSGGVCTINPVGGAAVAVASDNQATLVVQLPEDATLTIDNEPTTSTSDKRVFVTPSLETGKEYEYTLKAKVVRDGKVQTTTAQVTVRPGEVSRVELTIPATVAAQ